MAAAVMAVADASKRRRLILKTCSVCSAMTPSRKRRAGAIPLCLPIFSATSPFPGGHRAALGRLVRAPVPSSLMRHELSSDEQN